LDLKFTQSI